jgi:hypothetical protein
MQSDDQIPPNTSKPAKRRRNYDFYYYEQVGSRIYFRMTWFGAIFFMLSLLIPLVFMVLYHLFSQETPSHINSPPPSPSVQAPARSHVTPVPSPSNANHATGPAKDR